MEGQFMNIERISQMGKNKTTFRRNLRDILPTFMKGKVISFLIIQYPKGQRSKQRLELRLSVGSRWLMPVRHPVTAGRKPNRKMATLIY